MSQYLRYMGRAKRKRVFGQVIKFLVLQIRYLFFFFFFFFFFRAVLWRMHLRASSFSFDIFSSTHRRNQIARFTLRAAGFLGSV